MHVYIVCSGEFAEGHHPIGVRSSYTGAARLVGKHLPNARLERVKDGRWKAVAANGTDEVWIYRMAVDQ